MNHNHVKVIKTNNWLEKISIVQSDLKILNPIIVSSSGTSKRNNLNQLFSTKSLFTDNITNPTVESCQHALSYKSINDFDGVIAIGGGSVLDTGKVILASLKSNNYDIRSLLALDPNIKLKNKIPSIFIPTTHGTGSEVTKWGTIWDMIKKKKYSISHPDLYPDIALLDGKLTLSLPFEVAVSTTLDALSHSFEALWNKNSTNKSSMLAIEAICIIVRNIEYIIDRKDDLVVKQELLEASCLAGQAISITKTAASHSMSYPLTIFFNIPHGIAASFFLSDFIDMCAQLIADEIKEILNRSNLMDINELKSIISGLLREIKGNRLSNWGIINNDIDLLVKKSNTKERMENFLLELSNEDIRSLYLKYL